jgi:hypothetical protein
MKPAYRLGAVALIGVGAAFGLNLPSSATSARTAAAAPAWTATATVSPTPVSRGAAVSITATIKSTAASAALIDIEVYNASGTRTFYQVWDQQSFTAGQTRGFVGQWTVPAAEALNLHTVKIGVFAPGWASLYQWNNAGATFTVSAATGTTTTTRAPATTTTTRAPATTTTTRAPATTTTTVAPTGHFVTLPPGSTLPTDAQCAARVRPAPEVRPRNTAANFSTFSGTSASQPRATGSYHGTTDQIIQWTACKWGIDEDVVRAQVAKESWWKQSAMGDFTTNASVCAPGHGPGADGVAGQCPESVGLMQIRTQYFLDAINGALASSSYNLDVGYSVWRDCYEGKETWLNTVERGQDYAAGDMWGCVGRWFAGRWHTAPAETYITAVKQYLTDRVWTSAGFLADTGP